MSIKTFDYDRFTKTLRVKIKKGMKKRLKGAHNYEEYRWKIQCSLGVSVASGKSRKWCTVKALHIWHSKQKNVERTQVYLFRVDMCVECINRLTLVWESLKKVMIGM